MQGQKLGRTTDEEREYLCKSHDFCQMIVSKMHGKKHTFDIAPRHNELTGQGKSPKAQNADRL